MQSPNWQDTFANLQSQIEGNCKRLQVQNVLYNGKAMSEFRFKIDAYTPATIPMEVLAAYLSDLAKVLGAPNAVHFVRLEEGSVVPVVKVDGDAVSEVRAQVKAVKSGKAAPETMRAFHSINARLLSHGSVGTLIDSEASGAQILEFRGRELAEETYGAVRRQGTLDGEVIRVGGVNRSRVAILLQTEDRVVSDVHARKGLAQELGERLYRPVRLYGMGRWRRSLTGKWELEDFGVDRFESLKDDKLSSALAAVRSVSGGDWGKDSLREVKKLRHGDD